MEDEGHEGGRSSDMMSGVGGSVPVDPGDQVSVFLKQKTRSTWSPSSREGRAS